MGAGDSFAGHVAECQVHQLRGVSAAFADQMIIQPLLRDAFELAEQVEFGVAPGIAPFGVDQSLRKVVEQRRLAQVAGVHQRQVDARSDDALVARLRRPNQVGRQFERVVGR